MKTGHSMMALVGVIVAMVLVGAAVALGSTKQQAETEEGTGASPEAAEPTTPSEEGGETEAPAAAEAAYPGQPLLSAQGDYFMASRDCADCHNDLVDAAGNDVSMDNDWRATTHAAAARDPYWTATVRAEVLAHPALQAVIEDKCATCHMPMARTTAVATGGQGVLLDEGFLNPEHPLHNLAMDGVSCSSCHQIQATGLGEADSYSGGFVIDTTVELGERPLYGPYAATPDEYDLMAGGSGYAPVQSAHLSQSELCATCHTLYTPYVDASSGEVAGVFPEQMTYLEWLASDYRGEQTCQGCHMPEVPGELAISNMSEVARSPVSRHVFAGGNTTILRIMGAFAEELGLTASSEHIDGTIRQTVDQLAQSTARVTLPEVSLSEGRLTAVVAIESLVGHKLPTGFPSRRAWLHVVVRDASGTVIFESGAVGPDGSIAGNDNDADPAAFEPHYATIEQPDQVQIYETILGDTAGNVTTTLLLGAGYLKDNRLLPAGSDKAAAGADIAVHGRAVEDEDFAGGGDRVRYVVEVGEATAPLSVTAELLFQGIGYRWAENLRGVDAAEAATFMRYYDAVPNEPAVVGVATGSTNETAP